MENEIQQTQPQPKETPSRRTLFIIIGSVILAVIVVGIILALLYKGSGGDNGQKSGQANGTYADVSSLDTHKLSDGRTVFFQTMKHTNMQPVIASLRSDGYTAKDGSHVMHDLDFAQNSFTWNKGKLVDYSVQDLPAEFGTTLTRCIHGKSEKVDAITSDRSWKPSGDDYGLGTTCSNYHDDSLDGLFLVGGLSSKEADSWISKIQSLKDKAGKTPKLEFTKPVLVTYQGKKVVEVDVTVNSVKDGYCQDDYCGNGSIAASFGESTHRNTDQDPYYGLFGIHDPSATIKARYYIDPATNLIVYTRSQDLTNNKADYKDQDVADNGPFVLASAFQYQEPNWSSLSTTTLTPAQSDLISVYDSFTIR